ncbi:GNAT family N-acetyltransferase [Nitratireductor sp. PBL-C9]|uniref:GNAT family N-acetyltransferase n=1 Tax=Nitratireductor sp. PBL-C9 TaxID=3435013 RepID=UPI003D7EBA82
MMTVSNQPERTPSATASPAAGLTVELRPADSAALALYREDSAASCFMPAQSPEWVSAWARHSVHETLIVRLSDSEGHLLSLPLELAAQGRFRVARFIGDRHANGNFPLTDRRADDRIGSAQLRDLLNHIHDQRPDIDLLSLERQLHACDGVANPLLFWPHSESPNLSLAVDLEGGFDAALLRASGKRKRKQHRSQARKLEAAGGFERRMAKTPDEADTMLEAFFAMKAERFAQMGIQNVFAPAPVQAAFHTLFGEATASEHPKFVLHGLEVAGRLRAVTGSSLTDDRIICEFSSISDDELTEISPGRFLFFENIQEACEQGLKVYDFSVGDEYYKRLWCDLETVHFDSFVPLTVKGRAMALTRSAIAGGKRIVINDPRLWAMAKGVRKRLSALRR